jgi:hypothetical protein
MRAIFGYRRIWLVLLALPAWGLPVLAAANPAETELYYSRWIYPALASAIGRVTGLFPFSLAEFMLVSFALGIIAYTVRSIARKRYAACAATLLCWAAIIWFGFVALCGLNYHRETFAQNSGLTVRPSSVEELAGLCGELASLARDTTAHVARDDGGVMVLNAGNAYETAKLAPKAFAALGGTRREFAGFCARPKPVLMSVGLSLADIVGFYFPFTFEANINRDVVAYLLPSSMAHELAHFMGYMREDEANFIAYLACMASEDADFRYSGALLALNHSLNALYSADRGTYFRIIETLPQEVFADFAANDAFWSKFEGPIAEVSQTVNDVYLKSNRQEAGVKSYGQMVDLLLAEYRERHTGGF